MHTVLRYDEKPHLLTRCMFATGRSCILHLLRKYNPDVVFIPELYPAGVLDPIYKQGVRCEVYRIHDNFEVDLEDLGDRMRLSACKRPLIIQIHYFGYWLPSWGAAALARKYGGVLLEDCAHCLPTKDTKLCGDVRLYVYNKMFPVIDGAVMFSCSPEVDLTRLPGSKDLEPLQQEAVEPYALHLSANRVIAAMPTPTSELERKLFHDVIAVSNKAYEDYYNVISLDMEPRSMVSLEFLGQYDHEKEKKRRDRNSKILLGNIRECFLFRKDAPLFALPVHSVTRDEDLKILLDNGIAASYFSDLWSVPDHSEWNNHLLLPLRKKYDFRQLEVIRTLFG